MKWSGLGWADRLTKGEAGGGGGGDRGSRVREGGFLACLERMNVTGQGQAGQGISSLKKRQTFSALGRAIPNEC